MLKVLQPILHRDAHTKAVTSPILAYFREVLSEPIRDAAEVDSTRHNAKESALMGLLASGVIWYDGEAFNGPFNAETSAELSRMGAKFDRRSQTWKITIEKIPYAVRQKIYHAADTAKKKYAEVLAVLMLIRSNVPQSQTGIDSKHALYDVVGYAQNEHVKGLEKARIHEKHGIPHEINKTVDDLSTAIDADAKRIATQELDKLIEKIERLNENGGSLADLKKSIEDFEKALASRATAVGEHSVGILLSDFRKFQYIRMGSNSYVWHTMLDNRVRHDHRLLERKVFTWSNPPITNLKTGEHNHPGEDINCRCSAACVIST